jgi:hypothetical protein
MKYYGYKLRGNDYATRDWIWFCRQKHKLIMLLIIFLRDEGLPW